MELTEKLHIDEKYQKEIVRAARFGALAQIKEESPILLSIDDISIMLGRSYNYVARNIITLPSFPAPVTVEKGKETGSKFFRAKDFIRWKIANERRIA